MNERTDDDPNPPTARTRAIRHRIEENTRLVEGSTRWFALAVAAAVACAVGVLAALLLWRT